MHPKIQNKLRTFLLETVREVMSAQSKNQAQLARMLKISQPKVALIQNTTRAHNFSVATLLGYLLYLKVPVSLTVGTATITLNNTKTAPRKQ